MADPRAADPTVHPQSVLVVGASAAGLTTAEALRRNGYAGGITLLDAEPGQPYDRPPLSKGILSGALGADQVALRPPELLADLGAEFVLGSRATHLDVAAKTVSTGDGRRLRADHIVLATGLSPRWLQGQDSVVGVHVLRSLDDAVGLRARLRPGSRVVVVGNGVLGSEIAGAAAGAGAETTLLGSEASPMARQLGTIGAELLRAAHAAAGVRVIGPDRAARLLAADGHVTAVECESGAVLPADTVVVAIGSTPATSWLADSGLTIDDGIVCDERCAAAPGIWAAGDVARWDHPRLGSIRLENRTNATEQGIAVARNILGSDEPYAPVPYFWTDQYGVKIMVHGMIPDDADLRVVEGALDDGRFVAVAHDPTRGDPVGVLGWGMPKQTRIQRRLLDAVVGAGVPATVR